MKKGTVCLYISTAPNAIIWNWFGLHWLNFWDWGLWNCSYLPSPWWSQAGVVETFGKSNHPSSQMTNGWFLVAGSPDVQSVPSGVTPLRALQHWMWSSTTLQPSVGSPDKKSNKEMAADNVKFVKLHATNEVCLEWMGKDIGWFHNYWQFPMTTPTEVWTDLSDVARSNPISALSPHVRWVRGPAPAGGAMALTDGNW